MILTNKSIVPSPTSHEIMKTHEIDEIACSAEKSTIDDLSLFKEIKFLYCYSCEVMMALTIDSKKIRTLI